MTTTTSAYIKLSEISEPYGSGSFTVPWNPVPVTKQITNFYWINGTGGTQETSTLLLSRFGNMATIYINDTVQWSAATGAPLYSVAALPADFWPVKSRYVQIAIQNGGTWSEGTVVISPNGIVTVSSAVGLTVSGFTTGTNACGFFMQCATYPLQDTESLSSTLALKLSALGNPETDLVLAPLAASVPDIVYQTASITWTNGSNTAFSLPLYFAKVGFIVYVWMSSNTSGGWASAASPAATIVSSPSTPVPFIPSSSTGTVYAPILVQNGGTTWSIGTMTISTSGVITIGADQTPSPLTTFTASANCGFYIETQYSL
jgi:hypothetical protein